MGRAEEAARVADPPLRQPIADHAVVGLEQALEDQPNRDRRDADGHEQQGETNLVEAALAPQQESDAEPREELERDGEEGEQDRVQEGVAEARICEEGGVIAEAHEMPACWMQEAVIEQAVPAALQHRPDSDGQHVDECRRTECCEEDLAAGLER